MSMGLLCLILYLFNTMNLWATPLDTTNPFQNFPEEFTQQAEQHEKKGEWLDALQKWEVVRSFLPEDESTYKKVIFLKEKIDQMARLHFEQGVSFYQQENAWQAFKKFITTLSYDPNNEEALHYIKDNLLGNEFTDYTVKSGDTLKRIALEEYGNANFDFIIAYFNNLSPKMKTLIADSVIKVPILASVIETPSPKQRLIATQAEEDEESFDFSGILAKAKKLYHSQEYQKTMGATESILEKDPLFDEARQLLNMASYYWGKALEQNNQLVEALKAYQKATPNYSDIQLLVTSLENKLSEQANLYYHKGVDFFTKELYEDAIKAWEATLYLNPEHSKAKMDLFRAKRLLEKLEEF